MAKNHFYSDVQVATNVPTDVGQQILDVARRMTRKYCNDIECPEDGLSVVNNANVNSKVVLFTFIIGILILGITKQVTGRSSR